MGSAPKVAASSSHSTTMPAVTFSGASSGARSFKLLISFARFELSRVNLPHESQNWFELSGISRNRGWNYRAWVKQIQGKQGLVRDIGRFGKPRVREIGIPLQLHLLGSAKYSLKTRGTFRQVPTRRIRLSFVKCAYSDLRDIFFHNFRGLKWIPLSEKDGTQLQNHNFGTSYL